eukprot:TRINITY_DN35701_c0_g1_i1.p1 TRINITY_DN35701_c0_g1~~TRINITY_DN35701_c0_g1_i1.p1  ORF type:complete len:504 (+),score=112.63 TRINITY_DN35701_c0_g1_i1:155-1666(+)
MHRLRRSLLALSWWFAVCSWQLAAGAILQQRAAEVGAAAVARPRQPGPFLQKRGHVELGGSVRHHGASHKKAAHPGAADASGGSQGLFGRGDAGYETGASLKKALEKKNLDGDAQFETDLGFNPAENQDMAQDFRKMDDLEPVAPMDTIDVSKRFKLGGYGFGGGTDLTIDSEPVPASGRGFSDALYVPPYMRPDAFPNANGQMCACGQEKSGGGDTVKNVVCNCTASDGSEEFVTMEPMFNSSNFSLVPADMTYSNGNYWPPYVKDSIVAPSDQLRVKDYPIQAPADENPVVPTTARKDKIDPRFARYIDQVEARSRECDNVSPDCTVECKAGDEVHLKVGNIKAKAKVTAATAPDMITIEFVPGPTQEAIKEAAREAARKAAEGPAPAAAPAPGPAPGPAPAPAPGPAPMVNCPMSATCSAFEVCYQEGQPCIAQSVEQYQDFAGQIKHRFFCPDGFQLCGKVEQMVVASYTEKDGKACRPAAPTQAAAPGPAPAAVMTAR